MLCFRCPPSGQQCTERKICPSVDNAACRISVTGSRILFGSIGWCERCHEAGRSYTYCEICCELSNENEESCPDLIESQYADSARHCTRCTKYIRDAGQSPCQCGAGSSKQEPININCDSEWEIDAVIGKIRRYYDFGHVSWYKIRWKGWGIGHDKWCTVEELQTCQELVQSYNDAHTGLGRIT